MFKSWIDSDAEPHIFQHVRIQWNLYLRTLQIMNSTEITSLQRTLSKAPSIDFPIELIHLIPLKSGQPLNCGHFSWSQRVLHREVPRIHNELTHNRRIQYSTNIGIRDCVNY